VQSGFQVVKVKCGYHTKEEFEALRDIAEASDLALKLRLDFNERLSEGQVYDLFSRFSTRMLDALDFVEDPCVWDAEVWNSLQRRFGLRLALDRFLEKTLPPTGIEGFETLVVKPLLLDPVPVLASAMDGLKRVVFTSSLGHPFGQSFALFEASRALDSHPLLIDTCGLASHGAYAPQPGFDWRLEGSALVPPAGPGLGFGAALEALSWSPV